MTNPKIEGYELVNKEDLNGLQGCNFGIFTDELGNTYYFKPIEVYPKVFEGYNWTYQVQETGIIWITYKCYHGLVDNEKDLLALEQAIILSKKLREKK